MSSPTPGPDLVGRYLAVRSRSMALAAPLSVEDQMVQPMPDASPTKWHLAHTTWFFEAFVLSAEPPFDPAFNYLFNSYYEAAGSRHPRPSRGLVTRPGLARVHDYRSTVDERVVAALETGALDAETIDRLELGLHHEQQHQELLLTDIKVVLGTQPLRPAYRRDLPRRRAAAAPLAWRSHQGGIVEIGAPATGFAFDNERPRHKALVPAFRLASRPPLHGDVLAFIASGGYQDPRLWLSDGWATVQREQWSAPMYWSQEDGGHHIYDLAGVREVDPAEPACHISLYEADAMARWLGARLPTEQEWETAAIHASSADGNFCERDHLHPVVQATGDPDRLFGDVWVWTSSAYSPYPGYRPLTGALGEYNGKFMSGQVVLRGGSCFSSRDHLRASYRNFFPPGARWQMTGARLALDD